MEKDKLVELQQWLNAEAMMNVDRAPAFAAKFVEVGDALAHLANEVEALRSRLTQETPNDKA